MAFLTALDVLLVALAVGVMVLGLSQRWSFWRSKKKPEAKGSWTGMLAYVFAQREVLKRPAVGMAHLGVFWGMVLPVAVIIAAQFDMVLPKGAAHLLSLTQDLLGLFMLLAMIYLLKRRLAQPAEQGPQRTVLPMVVILTILISGFFAEGVRLGILSASRFTWFSPVGSLMAHVLPASPLFLQGMIRLHFWSVCILIAIIPFTFLRHVAAAPLNVFFKKQGPKAALRELDLESGDIGAGNVMDLSWKQLLDIEACVACGRCEEKCPAAISGKRLSPRLVMQQLARQANMAGGSTPPAPGPSEPGRLDRVISPEEFWACTSCMACVAHCPVHAEPLDKLIDLRRYQVLGHGNLPVEAWGMIRDLNLYGDVQAKGVAHRTDWAMHRGVPILGVDAREVDLVLWVGCAGAYHPRNQQTSRAMVKILQNAGARFAILGKAEYCCGDPARRLGEEALFKRLAQRNIDQFSRHGVKTVVTLCPHCLNTLKNEYPALGCHLEVMHATEYVMGLVNEGRIHLTYPLPKRIAIHDACYLGRYNGVYEAPRKLCQRVPGLETTELQRHRENGFCCGGGGGRMWLHEHGGQNINRVRAEEIGDSQAEVIGTSCPYCLVMLDDGVKSLDLTKTPVVTDVIEIVAHAMG